MVLRRTTYLFIAGTVPMYSITKTYLSHHQYTQTNFLLQYQPLTYRNPTGVFAAVRRVNLQLICN